MTPKTLQQIKDEVAKEYGYKHFNEMCDYEEFIEDYFEEIVKPYVSQEVEIAKEKGYHQGHYDGMQNGYKEGYENGHLDGGIEGVYVGLREERERHAEMVKIIRNISDGFGKAFDYSADAKRMLKEAGYLNEKK